MKKLLILVALIFFGTISYAGCNDPLACNYVSTDSDSQDCLLWTLSVGGGTSLSEMSWELYNSNNQLIASGMAPEVVCLPANDDCYEGDKRELQHFARITYRKSQQQSRVLVDTSREHDRRAD